MVNCCTLPCGTPGTTVNSGARTYTGPIRKLPSTVAGGFAPGAASVGLLAASLAIGVLFSAARTSASAFAPAATNAGVPNAVGGRVGAGGRPAAKTDTARTQLMPAGMKTSRIESKGLIMDERKRDLSPRLRQEQKCHTPRP